MSTSTDPREPDTAVDLFLAWMEESAEHRPTFDDLCARNPELRSRLTEIGAAHERARSLLESEAAGTLLAGSRYELRGVIACGGMGTILDAFDPDLHRAIAIKVPRARTRAASGADGAGRGERLHAEAQVLARLDHPGVVPIYAEGLDADGIPYFTMKRVEGQDFLAVIRLLRDGHSFWRLPRAIGVLRRVCEAVAYAHSKGVIHRDLKPANVMVGRFGEVYVMDWGLAKLVGESETTLEPGARATETSPRGEPVGPGDTRHGTVLGTPGYMAPEQARGEIHALDARTDVYALGAMLYHLLAGRSPRATGTGAPEPAAAGAAEPARLARLAPGAPEELVAIVEKAMAGEPAARYPSALELAGELDAWLEGRVVRAHRTGAWIEARKWVGRNRWAAAAAAAVVIGLVATALVQYLAKQEVAQRVEALRREDTLNRIALASSAFSNGDIGRMQDLLAGCPHDLRAWEWNYLTAVGDTSARTLRVEHVDLHAAQFFAGGRRLLTAGTGTPSQIALWDLPSGLREREIPLPEGCSINNVSFSADGALLAAFGRLGELFLWETQDWTPLPKLDARLHGWHGVAFAPSGHVLAAYGTEGVQLWDVDQRVCTALLSAGQKDISDVAWAPDGRRLCASSWDGSLSVWDVASGTLVRLLQPTTTRVQQVEWSPDGHWIAAGDWDSRIHVWAASTLAPVHRSDRIGGHVLALAWSPDSSLLAVGGKGVVIRLVEASSWEPVGRLVGHTAAVQTLAFSVDGGTLVSGCGLGTVRFWDLDRHSWRSAFQGGGSEPPAGVTFSSDGARAAVGWGGGVLEIWDTRRRERERRIEIGATIRHLEWARSASLVAVALWERDVLLVDPLGVETTRRIAVSEPTEVHFDPTGTRLAATAQDGVVRVWDVRSGSMAWEAALPVEPSGWPGNLFGASWSPDGRELVVSTRSGRIQIHDATSGALRRETFRPGMLFTQFCNAGEHVLAWAYAGVQRMELLDAATLEPVWTTRQTSHMWPVLAPDCSRVFSANWQGFLGVWDARTGRFVAELEGLPPGNPRLGVSPDGRCIVLAAGNRLGFFDSR